VLGVPHPYREVNQWLDIEAGLDCPARGPIEPLVQLAAGVSGDVTE